MDLSASAEKFDFLVQPKSEEGTVLKLPFIMDAGGIIYNTRLVSPPSGGGRWALEDLAESFSDRGEYFFAGGNEGFPMQAYILFDLCLTAEVLEDNPDWPEALAQGTVGFDHPDFMRAVERAAGLFRYFPKNYLSASSDEAVTIFQRGDHPALPVGTWQEQLFGDEDAPLRFEGLPVGGGGRVLRVYVSSLVVNDNSKSKKAAQAFVEYLLSSDVQETFVREGRVASPVRGTVYPAGHIRQAGKALEEAVFLADRGLFDIMLDAGVTTDVITAFYKGLFRAAVGGGILDPVIRELNYRYFSTRGMEPPPVPEGTPETSGGDGPNLPANP